MLKFRCQHCGQRIAVPARHLGKLVTCAECGAQTHPLAEQIVKTKAAAPQTPAARSFADAPSASIPTATTSSRSPCGNCGRPVGRLQTSHPWNGERVCDPCHHLLTAESSLGGVRAATVLATRVRPALPADPAAGEPRTSVPLGLREQVVRGLVVFIVGVVALYGALTLLRDLAGLIAVTAVAVLALVALYAVFRSRWVGRFRQAAPHSDATLLPARVR